MVRPEDKLVGNAEIIERYRRKLSLTVPARGFREGDGKLIVGRLPVSGFMLAMTIFIWQPVAEGPLFGVIFFVLLLFAGWFAPRTRSQPLRSIRHLYVGHYGNNDETESIMTLGFVTTNSWLSPRILIGYWLAPHVKERVFDIIAEFVEEQQIPLELRKMF